MTLADEQQSQTISEVSRGSEATWTLSAPSQDIAESDSQSQIIYSSKLTSDDSDTSELEISNSSQGSKSSEEVAANNISLDRVEYEELVRKAASYCNFKEEVGKIRSYFSNESNAVFDPAIFERICSQAGAGTIFATFCDVMSTERMSEERKKLNRIRAMVVIYMLMYGQSQIANLFQVALSRTLQQFGISEQGLTSLKNLGIAAHPHTVKAMARASASSHLQNISSFFQDAIENDLFMVMFIDDFHNIHTKHRPENKTQTQAIHMSTLLVKFFPGIGAIKRKGMPSALSQTPANTEILSRMLLSLQGSSCIRVWQGMEAFQA